MTLFEQGWSAAMIGALVSGTIVALTSGLIFEETKRKERRTLTIQLMKMFIDTQAAKEMELRALVSILTNLSPADSESIFGGRPFKLDSQYSQQLRAIFPDDKVLSMESGGPLAFAAADTEILRYKILIHLNLFEMFASAYVNDLVDKEMFDAAFKPLMIRNGEQSYMTFISATGIYQSMKKLYQIWS